MDTTIPLPDDVIAAARARVRPDCIEAARDVPIADVWRRLGFGEATPNRNVKSPWREESTGSVQVGGARNIVTDYGADETLDTIGLARRGLGNGTSFAAAVAYVLERPVADVLADAPDAAFDWNGSPIGDAVTRLASVRGWDADAMRRFGASAVGEHVHFAMRDADGATIGTRKRRGDGKPITRNGEEHKAVSVYGSKNGAMHPVPFPADGTVLVCEGEADACAAVSAGWSAVIATPGASVSARVAAGLAAVAGGRDVVLCTHPDDAGATWRRRVADALSAAGCAVREAALPDGDLDDFLKVLDASERASALERLASEARAVGEADVTPWPSIGEVVDAPTLRPVPPFPLDCLPDAFRDWVEDAASGMDAPVDYAAVGALVSAGSIIGRQCAANPKTRRPWLVIPNLWGAIIGPPSVAKTPSLQEVLIGIEAAQARAAAEHTSAMEAFNAERHIREARAKRAEKALAKNPDAADAFEHAAVMAEAETPGPVLREYTTGDATVEALAEKLAANPNGLLVYRDELIAWLRNMDRAGREGERGWFLEAWAGTATYRWARVGRGTGECPQCVSVLGCATPGELAAYVSQARDNGQGADGLLQRFQLAVYPDAHPAGWADPPLNVKARNRYLDVFAELANLRGLPSAEEGAIPALRFADAAQEAFVAWWQANAERSADARYPAALQAHFSKFRSFVPSLALIHELASGGRERIGERAVNAAIGLAGYFGEHAMRIYGMQGEARNPAAALAEHIRAGALGDRFTRRDVQRRQWRALKTPDAVDDALQQLEALNWIRRCAPVARGAGRPPVAYAINPDVNHA